MPKSVHSVIAKLFAGGEPTGETHDFTWRLIRRRRRPMLLLPVSTISTSVSLTLYSAQRRRAKIWRAMLPLLLDTPAAIIFHRIRYTVNANSDIVRFMSEQSGVPAGQLPAPAIKFGGMESQKSRLVLLVCDQSNRPIKVIKVGLDAVGRAATEHEANLLEQLPPKTIGCIRVTGRLTTPAISAFATDYFPGDSPADDLGMEILFHSWINPGPVASIDTFDAWVELETKVAKAVPAAWQSLRAELTGKSIHSTLYHGDFAPWNIRAVNLQKLEAFDWERGNLRGIPGWDWFHFVVQTSILARRHSVERVAAEVEELLQSPRFGAYAHSTGIHEIAKPLLLAYLLHHRWVVKPLEGGKQVEELYELLAAHWEPTPAARGITAKPFGVQQVPADEDPRLGLLADALRQLKSAGSQLANVFWEPKLTATVRPAISAQLKSNWLLVIACCAWITAVGLTQYYYTLHMLMLPFVVVPCLLATWKLDRRWGTFFAVMGAPLGPLVAAVRDSDFGHSDIICWNTLMRFVILQMCVFLTDRMRRQEDLFDRLTVPRRRRADFAGNWAIFTASWLWFFIVAWGDVETGPRVSFLPMYLFPAILMTLFMNLRWGMFIALLAALAASLDEYLGKLDTSVVKVFAWNFPMRFLVLYLIILLLDRLRQESVLFTPYKQNGGAHGGRHA